MTGEIVTIQDNSYITEVIVGMNTPMIFYLLFFVGFATRC
jgi:hypothetical protein